MTTAGHRNGDPAVFASLTPSLVNARVSQVPLGRSARWAVALCVIGVASFVIIAALVTRPRPASAIEAYEMAGIVIAVLAVLGSAYAISREALPPMFFVAGAGVLFGLVATLAKVSMEQVESLVRNGGAPSAPAVIPIVLCFAALTTAALFGSALVQRAYMKSTPDVVMAGLTVIDPIVAVIVGALILHEFPSAQGWTAVAAVCSAALAILGVCRLAITHPNSKAERSTPGDEDLAGFQ